MPSELWQLRNLVELGLRGNQLRDLPQSIGNLTKLTQLVVFANKLRWLPAEILALNLKGLTTGSNPFVGIPVPPNSDTSSQDIEADTINPTKHFCEKRQPNFRVPSLVEIVTRKLLEPMPTAKRPASISFVPTVASAPVKRYFHLYKDEAISPRVGSMSLPPHLLRPFIPLLRPNLPQHLALQAAEFDRAQDFTPPHTPGGPRNVTQDRSETITVRNARGCGNTRELLLCSVCKTACGELGETRIEWKREIAGVTLATAEDKQNWVPILWRGCSTTCLDFLDQ